MRELRQNLSVYLDRVKRGEVLTVTEHGQVVAVLRQPHAEPLTTLHRLVADGLATKPTRSLLDVARPRPARTGTTPAEAAIAQMRDERL